MVTAGPSSPMPPDTGLGKSLDFCHRLVEAVPDLLLLVNRQGRILYVNRPVQGMSREAVLGTEVLSYVPRELHQEITQSLQEIFAGAAPRSRELPASYGGVTRWFATHTGPVRVEG